MKTTHPEIGLMNTSARLGHWSLKDIIAEYREAVREEQGLPLWVRMVIAFFEYHPQPAWIKAVLDGGSTQMIRVNKAYERQLGITQERYQAQFDSELWSAISAAEMAATDQAVIDTLDAVPVSVRVHHPVTHQLETWVGWKWPIVTNGEVVAICGCAIREQE